MREPRPVFPFRWPEGYGVVGGALMLLMFLTFILPVTFLMLWAETGSVRSAWQILWLKDDEPSAVIAPQ